MEALEWLVLFGLAVVAIYGMATLCASIMAGSRLAQAQERMEREAHAWDIELTELDASLLYTPPVRTLESLAEQVDQMELRLRALELERGRG